jgi:hypothetical protein
MKTSPVLTSLALVGFLYPRLITSMDQTSTPVHNDDSIRKSQICKSLVIFVGINHLCAVSVDIGI